MQPFNFATSSLFSTVPRHPPSPLETRKIHLRIWVYRAVGPSQLFFCMVMLPCAGVFRVGRSPIERRRFGRKVSKSKISDVWRSVVAGFSFHESLTKFQSICTCRASYYCYLFGSSRGFHTSSIFIFYNNLRDSYILHHLSRIHLLITFFERKLRKVCKYILPFSDTFAFSIQSLWIGVNSI